ncbi:MAG TPA: cytochrome b/b6 domain-containing protein [Gammaproteobacteria bacterium]
MAIADTRTGYGWLSIAFHWITAIVVLTLWFIGSTIGTEEGADYQRMVRLHTSIAICAYLFLWARIVWRFAKGHPGPLPKQRGPFFLIGKYVHFALLIAIALQLISGPLMVWSGGNAIYVFDWFTIPSPLPTSLGMLEAMHTVHVWSARVIIVATILHLGGVYKHAAFNQDGTFAKMLIPAREER